MPKGTCANSTCKQEFRPVQLTQLYCSRACRRAVKQRRRDETIDPERALILVPIAERLIENPGLIKTAVEEILRFESSNQLGNRMTTERVEIGGISLAAGTPVTLCIGAANRDPQQFNDPETLDIGRTPNRHLAFATGAHQCAGMALARLEGAIAISRFLARFPDYALNGAPVRGGRVRFRGFLSVPCVVKT